MFLIGLTGGIAAGKSTVAKRWVEHGAIEIDADDLAREAVATGSKGLQQVVAAFGPEVLDAEGALDRKALASVIFGDENKRQLLNSILHPIIKQLARERLSALSAADIVVYNVPLLVEANVDYDFDLVVTVEAPLEQQIKRLVENRGLSEAEAKQRIEAQAKPIERAARSDRILNSNQDLSFLLRDADALWREIVSLASKPKDK
jgi:dephospho-CoA kinase